MRSLKKVAKETARILEEQGIEYVIVGGIAVAGWGNIRTTRDVDVIIALGADNVKKLVRAFGERGFSVSENDVLDALREKTHFTIFDERSEYHIHAKGVYGEKERRTLKTRKKVNLSGIDMYIASPEDIIANKLVFGSEQDLKDAEGIYIRQLGELDLEYLGRICREMGVLKELAELNRMAKKAGAE